MSRPPDDPQGCAVALFVLLILGLMATRLHAAVLSMIN